MAKLKIKKKWTSFQKEIWEAKSYLTVASVTSKKLKTLIGKTDYFGLNLLSFHLSPRNCTKIESTWNYVHRNSVRHFTLSTYVLTLVPRTLKLTAKCKLQTNVSLDPIFSSLAQSKYILKVPLQIAKLLWRLYMSWLMLSRG